MEDLIPRLLYFKVVPGSDLHKVCREWRRRYDNRFAMIARMVKDAFGISGVVMSHDGTTVVGLEAVSPLPPGWRVPTAFKGERKRMIPIKNKKIALPAHQFLDSLPRLPSVAEIAHLIGHPMTYSYEYEDGDGHVNSSGAMGYGSGSVSLGWAGGTFIISAANPEYYLSHARKSRGAIIRHGEWTPPASLIPITATEMEYLHARNKYLQERRKAKKAQADAKT